MRIEEFKVDSKTSESSGDWPQESVQGASCADGVCGVDFGSDASEVNFGALASLSKTTELLDSEDPMHPASCADGVCGVDFGNDAPEVDFGALASLGNPTESRNSAESESES